MPENGVGRHMGVMTQRRLPVSHISARQPDLHTIDESPHQGPVGKEQWDDIEVLVSSAPPTPKMQHARVQGNVSGFGGLHGPASKRSSLLVLLLVFSSHLARSHHRPILPEYALPLETFSIFSHLAAPKIKLAWSDCNRQTKSCVPARTFSRLRTFRYCLWGTLCS